MKAMILAAGRGERMRPLTDKVPKPLLQAGKHRLIEYHLLHLQAAGFRDIIINVAWHGQQIIDTLGNGSRYALNIQYSNEGDRALETGGGIVNALPLLGDDPFVVINGDVWSDYPLQRLRDMPRNSLAHLVLINNPPHHPHGDFYFEDHRLVEQGTLKYTFSGIGVYSPDLFRDQNKDAFPLAPLIRRFIREGRVTAELYEGEWIDVGTPERLELVRQKSGE